MSFNLTAGNPRAHRIRVYYENADSTTIAEGMPLCYNYDTTDNWHGGSMTLGAVTETGTTAEGSHNEGKYIRVEDPTVANLGWFAGVVAKGSPGMGKAVASAVDIYIPNGAIVPVLTVLAATVTGRTILAINSDTSTFGNPTTDAPNYGLTAGTIDARPVAIAEETISEAGLVLARLDENMFIHQGGQVGQELHVGYVGTVATSVNRMFLDFDQTAGYCQALHCRTLISSTGLTQRGVYRFETFVKAAHINQVVTGFTNIVDLSTAFSMTSGHVCGIHSTIRSRSVNPTMAGNWVYAYKSEIILTKTTTTALDSEPDAVAHFYLNSDVNGTTPTCLFLADNKKFVPMEATAVAADDAAANSIVIHVEGADYYIPAYTAAELA